MVYVALLSLLLLAAIALFVITRKYQKHTRFEKSVRVARQHATAAESATRRRAGRSRLLSLIHDKVRDVKRTPKADIENNVRKTAKYLLSEVTSPAEYALIVAGDPEQEIKSWHTEIRKSVESLLPPDSPRKICNRCGEEYLSDLADPDSTDSLCAWCELKPPADSEIEFRPDTPQRIRDIFIYALNNPPAAEFRDLGIQLSEEDLCHDDNPQMYPGVFLDYAGTLRVTAAIRRSYGAERAYRFAEQPRLVEHGFSIEESPVWVFNAWKRYENTYRR